MATVTKTITQHFCDSCGCRMISNQTFFRFIGDLRCVKIDAYDLPVIGGGVVNGQVERTYEICIPCLDKILAPLQMNIVETK